MNARPCRMPVAILILSGFISLSRADIIWLENFSDVSDWQIIFNANPGDASSITSDGSMASLYVETDSSEVAFGLNTGVATLVPFNPVNKDDYSMTFTVDSLTGSMSYDIRLDLFDNTDTYLGTVFGIVPQGTFVGTDTIDLGAFTYDPDTVSVAPKITVFTGLSDQTVVFDQLYFEQIPEPSVALLLAMGLVLVRLRRNRPARAPGLQHR